MSSSQNLRPKPCRFYNSPGGCRFGANCKFEHRDAPNNNPARSISSSTEAPPQDIVLLNWKSKVPKTTNASPLGHRLASFFQHALRLVKDSDNSCQQVIDCLATEGGLLRIKELVDSIFQSRELSTAEKAAYISNTLLPFFELLTHDKVLNTMLFEEKVAQVYNFLYGFEGRRFSALVECLEAILIEESSPNLERQCDLLGSTITIFNKILDIRGSAILSDQMEQICEKLSAAVEIVKEPTSGSAFLHAAVHGLNRARARFGRAALMSQAETTKLSTSTKPPRPKFQLQRDPPGLLSERGPRHDNDSDDITAISIMPTAAEITADRPPYLPGLDPFERHILGTDGLIDRHFRLLREDTVGQIRDAIKSEISRIQSHTSEDSPPTVNQGSRVTRYTNARLSALQFDKQRGLDFMCEFDQPAAVRKLNLKERREWWEERRRLQNGSFACLLDSHGNPLFCYVSTLDLSAEETPMLANASQSMMGRNLYTSEKKAYVMMSLVDSNADNIRQALLISTTQQQPMLLIEFIGVLLPSFQPTLKALQSRVGKNDLPFAEILAPTTQNDKEVHEINIPLYARANDFQFDLSPVTDGQQLSLSPGTPFSIDQLVQASSLDHAQAVALVDALRREVALIQGPRKPRFSSEWTCKKHCYIFMLTRYKAGTGKSYTGIALIKTLLASRAQARLGPILCTCYTNHALDQLLTTLVEHGVTSIVRIGSRSKSEILQDLNLRAVAQNQDSTLPERMRFRLINSEMQHLLEKLNDSLEKFANAAGFMNVLWYLSNSNSFHCEQVQQLYEQEEEGWQTVRRKKSTPLQDWADSGFVSRRPARPQIELERVSIFNMTRQERKQMLDLWILGSRNTILESIESHIDRYQTLREQLEASKQERDLRCLQQAHVIGVTTSGLAKISNLLSRVQAKVLMCEEAGEVLEAHTLTTLLPSIEHAILIGDHQQLRPQIESYELHSDNPRGKQYSLDLSLFERLVNPPTSDAKIARVPFNTLTIQRRMHPSISALIRETSYQSLKDEGRVQSHPEVAGVKQRLRWVHHCHPEGGSNDDEFSTSHSNDFEVDMVTAFVSHLVKQGAYRGGEIAVLTPYLGQMRKLRTALSKSFAVVVDERDIHELEREGAGPELARAGGPGMAKTSLLRAIRVATVDNFQGEEAKVVLVSLVRSNRDNRVGFLRTSNRINVLLSRAQHGMYLFGNATTALGSQMWSDVLALLEAGGNVSDHLELSCPRHPDALLEVRTPGDFERVSPEGGCSLMCGQRLQCGHTCTNRCHSQTLHEAAYCAEECQRRVPGCNDHPCPNRCGDACPQRCAVEIEDVQLSCGHRQALPCFATKDLASAKCTHKVDHTMQSCGHETSIECWETALPDWKLKCSAPCSRLLSCGHICERPCHECCKKGEDGEIQIEHGKCKQPCRRPYTVCTHVCMETCHDGTDCQPCKAPCEVECAHSACKKLCCEPCVPCAEDQCSSGCPHEKCNMPCAIPCDWLPCSKRCTKMLGCGHQCPSVCGEACPDAEFCQKCCSLEVGDLDVDFIMGLTYKEVNLDEDPCIFPSCGHIVTMTNLDGVMDMQQHYITGEDGQITGIKHSEAEFSAKKDLKSCPTCRGSLRNIARYSRLVKRALLDESTKRLSVWAAQEFAQFAERYGKAESHLQNEANKCNLIAPLNISQTRDEQFTMLSRLPRFAELFKAAIRLRHGLSRYCKKIATEEQPYNQAYNLVENLRRRRGIVAENLPAEFNGTTMVNTLRAQALLIRLDLALINKAVTLKKEAMKTYSLFTSAEFAIDLAQNRADCETLIEAAKASKHPVQEAEAHILLATHYAFESSLAFTSGTQGASDQQDTAASMQRRTQLREAGLEHLAQAEEICKNASAKTSHLTTEIEQVEKMLKDSFYETVSNEERKAVYEAMSSELRGTGHWYRCTNGHPFTIGECGLPMEMTLCPECGAGVGGQNHQVVGGATVDREMDEQMAGLDLNNERVYDGR